MLEKQITQYVHLDEDVYDFVILFSEEKGFSFSESLCFIARWGINVAKKEIEPVSDYDTLPKYVKVIENLLTKIFVGSIENGWEYSEESSKKANELARNLINEENT